MGKYHGESLPEIEEEKLTVSKVHFLIHPGFISDDSKLSKRTTPEDLEAHHKKFLHKAETLPNNEIMFAFSHASKQKFRTDFEMGTADYITLLKSLKEILGKRLIILTDDLKVMAKTVTSKKGAKNVLPTMEKLAEARGYKLSKEMLSEVYGELVVFCTNYAGESLNEALNLKQPTAIKTQLTDMPLGVTVQGSVLNKSYNEGKPKAYKPIQKRVFFDFE